MSSPIVSTTEFSRVVSAGQNACTDPQHYGPKSVKVRPGMPSTFFHECPSCGHVELVQAIAEVSA